MAIDTISSSKEKTTSSDITEAAVKRHSYPSSVESNEAHNNYLIFHIVQPMSEGNLNDSTLKNKQMDFLKNPASVKTIGMIQLYMPNLTENLSHDYSKNETSIWTDFATEWVNAPGEGLDRLGNAAGGAFDRTLDRLQQSALNNKTITQTTGQIHKQRNTLLYGGTGLRQQTFTFDMRPRNLAELKEIGEILYMFRRYSSGTRGSSAVAGAAADTALAFDSIGTINVPPLWFVEERIKSTTIKTRSIDKFMMGPAVITGININKTPDQIYKSISGTAGDPIHIELEITMQEVIPTYSDYWDELRNQTLGATNE